MAYRLIGSTTTLEGQTYRGTATEITASAEVYGPGWYIGALFNPARAQAEFERLIQPYGAKLLRLDVYEDIYIMPEAPSEFPTEPMLVANYKLVGYAHGSPIAVALIAALPWIIRGAITAGILFLVWKISDTTIGGIKDILWGEKVPGKPDEREGGLVDIGGGLGGIALIVAILLIAVSMVKGKG